MRVVQFAGWSGTGKTTLIEEVIDAAPPGLTIGVVKHLGGVHPFELDPGRDTTRFYERGARAVTGIDAAKGVTVLRSDTLFTALDRLSDAGCGLALVEGFKTEPFARVVIGDLPSDRCVLRNPTADEVLEALDRFDEYVSPGGLLRACRERAGGSWCLRVQRHPRGRARPRRGPCGPRPARGPLRIRPRRGRGPGARQGLCRSRDNSDGADRLRSLGGSAAFAALAAAAGDATEPGGRR